MLRELNKNKASFYHYYTSLEIQNKKREKKKEKETGSRSALGRRQKGAIV